MKHQTNTGRIKRWVSDRGYGFVTDDTGGPDIFFHIGGSQSLRGNEDALISGTQVTFRKRKGRQGEEAYDVHLDQNNSLKLEKQRRTLPYERRHLFNNPYTFIFSPPRKHISDSSFAGDFDPIAHGLGHDRLVPELWTGHLPITLTAVTPLLLPDANKSESLSSQHKIHDMLTHLPESSLRGMLRNAYEIVTNSRYTCFRNDERLSFRMDTKEALKLIPAIIEAGAKPGMLKARLYLGDSCPTPKGPDGKTMYAATFTCYGSRGKRAKIIPADYQPRTGDEVWVEIVRTKHRSRRYSYWQAIKIYPTSRKRPQVTDNRGNSRIVQGRVFITNENMSRKHDERIFFGKSRDAFDVTHLKDAWRNRIQSYRSAHTCDEIFKRKGKKPWEKLGNTPGQTAWSPHLYLNGKQRDRWGREAHDALELRPGDMVYARCQFNRKDEIAAIEDLFPVMISRGLYERSPKDLLDISLHPAQSRNEASPAERLFGWVPQLAGSDEGYQGRIRIVCEDGERPDIVQSFSDGKALPLTILGQPKPAQGRFYVAKNATGRPQEGVAKSQAGYSEGKALRGRKQYWHHKGLEYDQALDYWQPSAEDRTQNVRNGRFQEYRRPDDRNGKPQTDSQNCSIKGWIKPNTIFRATLHLHNLQPEEMGALLWLSSLPPGHFFKLGYGKPLGFGSMKLEIDRERSVEDKRLPLGTGKDWKNYYATLDAQPPATLDATQWAQCIQAFQSSIVSAYGEETIEATGTSEQEISKTQRFDNLSFIKEYLQVLKGPSNNDPVHYPRLESKPNRNGENFKWFVENERRTKHSLPSVTEKQGLPYFRRS